MMDRGNRRLQYLVAIAISSSAITVGVSFSWATPVLPKIARNEIGLQISESQLSWMVAISSIGFIIGSLVARQITDRRGRKVTVLVSAAPILIGTILKIFAFKWYMLCSARYLWGLGTGMIGAVTSLYLAEITDKEIRGSISVANRFMMSFGCLLVISIGAFVPFRTLNYMLLALPILQVAACSWIPESPYYLLKLGKVELARKTLQRLTGIRDEDVLEEKLSEMRAQVKIEMSRASTIKEFVTSKRYRKAIIIIIVVKVTQIMTGLHAVQNYLGSILLESNTGMDITTSLIIFGACRFLLGIMSSILVDKVGRRPLIISSFFGTGALLAGVAIYYGICMFSHEIEYPYTLIPFIGIIMALAISVFGYESVAYIMPAELFPMNVKATAMVMVSVIGGLTNFTTVKTFQPMKDLTGLFGVFVMYAVAAFLGGIFSIFLVLETKGKSLREIQSELQGDLYEGEIENLNTLNNVEDDNTRQRTDN